MATDIHTRLFYLALVVAAAGIAGTVHMLRGVVPRPWVPPEGESVFALAQGTWAWTTSDSGCAGSSRHRIAVSADSTVMTITASEPYERGGGETTSVAV